MGVKVSPWASCGSCSSFQDGNMVPLAARSSFGVDIEIGRGVGRAIDYRRRR